MSVASGRALRPAGGCGGDAAGSVSGNTGWPVSICERDLGVVGAGLLDRGVSHERFSNGARSV